jgi:hypothetical protein
LEKYLSCSCQYQINKICKNLFPMKLIKTKSFNLLILLFLAGLAFLFTEKAQAAIIAQYTGGIVVYADGTTGTPKYKVFDDSGGFGSEQSASSVGSSAIEWIRVAASPTDDEWIIATRDAGDVIKAQICTGVDGGVSCGTPTQITATAGTHGLRNFDVAYEQTSGQALLVYGTATADELRKIEWTGSWGSDAAITTNRTTGTVEWVELTARPGSDQIGIAYSDSNDAVSAYRWSGTAAGDEATANIGSTAITADFRKFDVSFEGTSGDMLVVAWVGAAGTARTGQLVGSTWTIGDQTAVDVVTGFVDLPEVPTGTNYLGVSSHGAAATTLSEGFAWTGSAVTDGTNGDDNLLTWAANYQLSAIAYLNSTYPSVAVISNSAATDDIDWWTMSSAGAITDQTVNTRTRGAGRFRDLFDYPNADKVLLLTTDANSDLWADTWDGAAVSGTAWTDRTSGGTLEDSLVTATTDVVDFAFRLAPPPGIIGSLGKTADGWSGAVPVYGTLTDISHDDYPYARAQVTTIASQVFYTDMTWSSGNSRYEGTIYVGSNICTGCDDPKTYSGSFSVVVQLDNNSGFPSIDYSGSAVTFTTAVTLKRSSMDAATNTNYTDYNAAWSTDHWNISINDFAFSMNTGTGTNFAVAVPIYPTTSSPSNFTVAYNGSSISQGTAASTVNAWWYESTSHTLYLQFASLTTTLVDVDITFDNDTDLFATRYNWTMTADMGTRKGSNGLYIANQYLTTFYYGKPLSTADNNVACSGNECEMTGMQAESRAHETGGPDESTDCMERIAVHVDDTPRSDGTGYYQYDTKWKQSETPSWIISQSNSQFVLETNSDDTASTGWAQQLNNGIAAKRTQTIYSGKRYIKNEYVFTNNGASAHKYPMVWEREQWHSTDRQTNDHGRFQGDTSDVVMEQRQSMSGYSCPWQTSYDSGTYINMGMVYDANNLPDYGVFAVEAFLAPTTAEWPLSITNPHATQTTDQTGFEKTWASVGVGSTASFTFWHVHNAESSWANIATAMDADCDELNASTVISLTISDGTIGYGNVIVGTPKDTTSGGLNDTQTVTNNGNVAEDFEIQGINTANWTLGASAGDAIYKHAWCTSNCDSSPTWNALTAAYQTLVTNIGVSSAQDFDLQVTVPTVNSGTNQQDVSVTVRAIEH